MRDVVPSAKDGLHCGQASGAHVPVGPGRPVRQGRAPLRLGFTRLYAALVATSSRPPRTGSIAAAPAPPRPRTRPMSSRPPRTGSIAAARSPRCRRASRRSSRPPRTGSIAAPVTAPRRRTGRPVVPSAKDGLHCGASWKIVPRLDRWVVPSAKDGLHCGSPPPPGAHTLQFTSSRPPRTGSIAAGERAGCGAGVPHVVPSAKDGLHCGHVGVPVTAIDVPPVVPSAKAGLHCGRPWPAEPR